MQQESGYVKIHRKLLQWVWYKNLVIKSVFLHCIFAASFTERPYEGGMIHKGQLVTTYKNLALDLGLTVQQVRTAIKKLKSTGEITCEPTNKYTVITVVNWEEYQFYGGKATHKPTRCATNGQQSSNNQITNKQQTTGVSSYIIKNDKNGKKEKNNTRAREDVLSDKPPCGGKKTHTLATGEVLTDAEYKARIAALRR